MADVPALLTQLAKDVGRTRGVDEFVVSRTTGDVATARGGLTKSHQRAKRDRIEVTVHRDLRRGRGTARFTLPAEPRRAVRFLSRQAAIRAARSRGPSWSLPPPSAPARVDIADPLIAEDPHRAANEVLDELAQLATSAAVVKLLGKPLRVTASRAEATSEAVSVITSRGFARAFECTSLSVNAALAMDGASPGAVERVLRKSRRRGGLALEDAVMAAAERTRARTRAKAIAPGTYDLVLTGDALTARFRGLPYGWLSCVVAQTSASLERQGLTRYKPGQSIFGGHKPAGDPITITSDGTLPFGELSRPFGDRSEPVRRWPMVRDGVAAGLSLDLREAALRGTLPNGGVRNLVVAPGKRDVAELSRPSLQRPVLRAEELAWLEVDLRTGRFTAELGFAYVSSKTDKDSPVFGGAIRGDVFALLAAAHLSKETHATGWYAGPRALRVDGIAVA